MCLVLGDVLEQCRISMCLGHPAGPDQVLGRCLQLQLHQTLALANANIALEMLRGFSPLLLKRAYVLTTNKQVCKESIFKMITGYQ